MRITVPLLGEVTAIVCPPITTPSDDRELELLARFLAAIPEIRAGRACITRYGAAYAGVEWKEPTDAPIA